MRVEVNVAPEDAYRELAARTAINVEQLRRAKRAAGRAWQPFPVLNGLRNGTLRYGLDGPDRVAWSKWYTWEEIQQRGFAHCPALACAVAAEYLVEGLQARPVAFPVTRDGLWHVVVEVVRPNGLSWYGDPSVLGGMGRGSPGIGGPRPAGPAAVRTADLSPQLTLG